MGRSMQVMRWAGTLGILSVMMLASGCARLILGVGFPRYSGTIRGLPLQAKVEVIRDSWGVPHIYASTLHDLMFAQGFVHSQDRLWQMELFRRMAQGRLSEWAGDEALDVDLFIRMLGIPALRKRVASGLSKGERSLLEAYVSGINAFLRKRGEDLPLEFRFGLPRPKPWRIEDALSILPLMSWFLETNYRQELLALEASKSLDSEALSMLFPSHPGARLQMEPGYERIRALRIGPVLREAKAFFREEPLCALGSQSNNWVFRNGPRGRPMLANDPHLALLVPGIWYFCHLSCPTLQAAGASVAGTPGIVIGHNGRVAWGFTNLMADIVDIYVLRVDPEEPTRYFLSGKVLEMTLRRERIQVKGKGWRERSFYVTVHGPVITRVKKGIDAVAVLKWPGTLSERPWQDHSFRAFLGLMRAGNVRDALAAGRYFTLLGLNLVAADRGGDIGYHATGGVPLRRGYSGRLPVYASQGGMGWIGRLPYDSLPRELNPPRGWIATANQRVVPKGASNPISFSWCAPYRWERICSYLRGLRRARVRDFARIQMDVHALRADRILPEVLSYTYRDKRAKRAVEILRGWDRQAGPDSVGAAVYEVFLTEWVKELLEDDLGEGLSLYFQSFPAFYLVQDVILQRPSCALWDRTDTPRKETPRDILERSLVRAMQFLEKRLGPEEKSWSWGRLHRIAFCHPGARGLLTARLLGRGPFPSGGDNTTVNVAGFIPSKGRYDVLLVPSMRMIVPMGDLDHAKVIAPMGQSGQPYHPHYDDMTQKWLNGEYVDLPFERRAVERAAAQRLVLSP